MPLVATLREVDQPRNVERGLTGWVDAVLATEGRFYERIEYLSQCADCTAHDPAARLETRAETADRWASIPRMCPSCGLITSRVNPRCLECGVASIPKR